MENITGDLCKACGLCCGGALHARVGVSEKHDDIARLEAEGLEITPTADGPALTLPCSAHVGDHCRVYSHRPGACRAFRCLTLQRYESGQLSRNDAFDIVRDALALRAEIRQLVVEAGGPEGLRRVVDIEAHLAAVAEADQAELTARYADALLALAHLRRFLGDHFVEAASLKEERTLLGVI